MERSLSRRMFVMLTGAGAAALAIHGAAQAGSVEAAVAGQLPTTGHAAVAQPQAGLDPQMQEVIAELMSLQAPKLVDMNYVNARQTAPLVIAAQQILTRQGKPCVEPVANINHRLIPGGAGQQMLVRIYQPAGPGPFPALVYFHGGGWVIANLDTYDSSCRALTNAAQCAVISVAYRQAPENPFPAAPDDALAAYQWVINNAASIRVDPKRVAVGGESAGGNLATVTARRARDRGIQAPVHQLLIYPVTTSAITAPVPDFASYRENMMTMPLATPGLAWFFRYYLRRPSDGASPDVSPLRAANLGGLPPATVITAQFDPLRDEGEAYATRLREAGVPTTLTRYDGVTHEFFSLAGILDKAKAAVMEAAMGLKMGFGG